MAVLLVTLAIGKEYLDKYSSTFRPSHEAYAEACGYDFRIVSDYLDPEHRTFPCITMNKLLLCSQEWAKKYDFLVFVDADVLIRKGAPAIHTLCSNSDLVGIVDEYSQPDRSTRESIQRNMGWESSAVEYYKLADLDLSTSCVLNTGVMVFQPRKHADVLSSIYYSYIDTASRHRRGFHFEQSVIGYELQARKLYLKLPNVWNMIYFLYRKASFSPEEILKMGNMIHFTGNVDHDKVPSFWKSQIEK